MLRQQTSRPESPFRWARLAACSESKSQPVYTTLRVMEWQGAREKVFMEPEVGLKGKATLPIFWMLRVQYYF